MKQLVKSRNAEQIDFEELGFQTMLETGDETRAKPICALKLHAYEESLRPELSKLSSEIQQAKNRAQALHCRLYDRPIPVNDAAMLVRSLGARVLLVLAVLAGFASLAGNTVLFYLFGFDLSTTLLLAAGTTALPLVVGHLAYEKIVARHRIAETVVIVAAAALCLGGLVQLGQSRRDVVDKAAANQTTSSYVDENPPDNSVEEPLTPQPGSESKSRQTLGRAMFIILMAADLMLGLLAGLLTRMRTDEDYAAWHELKKISETVIALEKTFSEQISSIEIAKVRCMAGILRAKNIYSKRRVPYHQLLTVLMLFLCAFARASQAQTIRRYEGILIDTSGSIGKGNPNSELFREYLLSTKKLLLTEPPNSRVWVSTISTDSFGGVSEILKGWTPDAHGVFTDDLNRARHQLASSFETKSSGMSPVSAGTDIFGGLWSLKARFESAPNADRSQAIPKTIWIFSDMMNETKNFPMPDLVAIGPEQMFERAKANGLLLSLEGYRVYVYGVSTTGLTPQTWAAAKKFWTIYFDAVGAELIIYSAACDGAR